MLSYFPAVGWLLGFCVEGEKSWAKCDGCWCVGLIAVAGSGSRDSGGACGEFWYQRI